MNYSGALLVISLCCFMVSCAPWRDNYLDSGIGMLTQPAVKGKLGKPHIVNDPLLSPETTWMYRYTLTESELDPWGVKTFGKGAGSVLGGGNGPSHEKIYCFVYVLVFDKDGVLRQWEREVCQVPQPPNLFQQELSGKLLLQPDGGLPVETT